MIDTDKYEGHSEDRVWKQYSTGLTSDYVYNSNDADENLVRDAPLLLAEVKRLQEVAYLRICMIGERDKEIGRLREGIERIAKVQSIALHIEKALKELIE